MLKWQRRWRGWGAIPAHILTAVCCPPEDEAIVLAEQHIDNVFPKPSPSAFLSRRRPPFLLNCVLQDKHEESHDLGRMLPLNSLFRLTWANTKHDKGVCL